MKAPDSRPARPLAQFVQEDLGDPLGGYPRLLRGARPYNLWLTETVLEVVLVRWEARLPGPRPAVAADLEWACGTARRAFREILPAALGLGDGAVLAALGVTANLQRTLGLIAEAAGASEAARRDPLFRLSRLWCGLAGTPEGLPRPFGGCRLARSRPPDPRRRDPAHLVNALGFPPSAVKERCANALAVLGREIRRSGLFGSEDLRHLCGHSVPGGFRRAFIS